MRTTRNKEADKDKDTSSEYHIKGKEKALSMYENKEKACDVYFFMYECGKKLLHSTHERACAAHDTPIDQMKEIVDIFNYEIK